MKDERRGPYPSHLPERGLFGSCTLCRRETGSEGRTDRLPHALDTLHWHVRSGGAVFIQSGLRAAGLLHFYPVGALHEMRNSHAPGVPHSTYTLSVALGALFFNRG